MGGFKLSRHQATAATITLLVVLFLALNVFALNVFRSARLDLTSEGLFTLDDGTVRTLEGIEEPITFRLYYSETSAADIQQIRVMGERVRDLLSEFASVSDGKLIVEVIDPEPYTEAEDQAVASGLKGAQVVGGEIIYFGLVASNTIDGQEVIPFFATDREQYLEYDLASMIYRLNRESQPVLGLLSDLPLDTGPGGMVAAMQGNAQPFMIYEEMLAAFEVEQLTAEFDRIPPEVEVLLIAHPPALGQKALYAIDQFVMRGGRVLAFVDPFSELSQVQGAGGQGFADSSVNFLAPLLNSWGVEIDGEHIVGDLARSLRVGWGNGADNRAIDYVVWIGLEAQDFNSDDIVTGSLNRVQMASVGAIKSLAEAGTRFTPLITSSDVSMLLDFQDVKFQTPPDELLRKFLPDDEAYVIAARVFGPVKTMFSDGPPPPEDALDAEEDLSPGEDEPEQPLPAHIASTEDANVIVVADADLFDDRFWVQVSEFLGERYAEPTADNGAFVIGAIDNLMGSNDLISLRSRARANRSFTVVEDIRRAAEAEFLPRQEELDSKLDQISQRVDEIRGSLSSDETADETVLVTPEERTELQQLLNDAAETRKARRDIQYNLRKDIDRLGSRVKFVNIALMPLLIGVFAVGLALYRRRDGGRKNV